MKPSDSSAFGRAFPLLAALAALLGLLGPATRPASAQSSTPPISWQARLGGLPDGPVTLTFGLFNAPEGGTQCNDWIDVAGVITGGIVSVSFEVGAECFGVKNGSPATWLAVRVNGDPNELSPRTQVTAVPTVLAVRGENFEISGREGNAPIRAVTRMGDGTGWLWTFTTYDDYTEFAHLTDRGNFWLAGELSAAIVRIPGADVAESFDIASATDDASQSVAPAPGMVVSIDPDHPGDLRVSSEAYDARVAGAISGAHDLSVGVMLGQSNGDPLIDGSHPVAMSGRAWVWCDASFGAIKPGDRLTTSSTPGHAMVVGDAARADGAVIGKAMTELNDGKGLVLVLVNLQ